MKLDFQINSIILKNSSVVNSQLYNQSKQVNESSLSDNQNLSCIGIKKDVLGMKYINEGGTLIKKLLLQS